MSQKTMQFLSLIVVDALASYHSIPTSATPRRHAPPVAFFDDLLPQLSPLVESITSFAVPDSLNSLASSIAVAVDAEFNALEQTAVAANQQLGLPPNELIPLLEAKQAQLLDELKLIESLIEQAQPPKFPNDLSDLFARDFAGPILVAFGLASSKTLDWTGGAKIPSQPYPTGRYDPETAAAYYAAKPWAVLCRLVESGIPASGWAGSVLIDWLRGPATLKANARVRAEQLVSALTAMGPTYIKVGQALSIRADLLPPEYITALTGLQDRVPAFDSETAKGIMAEEWQLRDGSAAAVRDLFSVRTEVPVAAASLGQVYRGTLRDGNIDVAIKVQRPEMEGTISLDLIIIRSAAAAVKKLQSMNSDLVGLVDDWGRGFVDELDYTLEASNTAAFFESIAESPLSEVVTAPEVVQPLSTRRVLVTKWIDGERLERSQADDVSKLCGVALNTYLSMLLSTGLLHCDPHPGNLLRTKDGKLCILDWGLVTTVDEELQLTFLEHVAHLTAQDYAKVPSDLIGLGFVPEGMEEAIRDSPEVVETLSLIYRQWAGGGGAAKIDVNEVSSRLQKLTEDYGNFFQIPPYFAYVLRAFSVLEGIALINDPEYSILNECLPYISQRVLTDASPRARHALQSFVYDQSSSDTSLTHQPTTLTKPVLDAPRLARLADGFKSFSASAGGLSLDGEEQLERLAGQLVDLLVSREGSPLQDLVLDEAARLADASVRDLVEQAKTLPPQPVRPVLSSILDPLE